jgi:hypothetical protein
LAKRGSDIIPPVPMEENDRKRMLRETRRMVRILFKRLGKVSRLNTEGKEEVSISNAILRLLEFERSLREHRPGPKGESVREMENIQRQVSYVILNT